MTAPEPSQTPTLRDQLLAKFAPFYMGAGCLTPKEMADMALEVLASVLSEPTEEMVEAAEDAHFHEGMRAALIAGWKAGMK